MAIAKIVCGDCDGVLSQDDKFCPQCGARIERVALPEARLDSPKDTTMRCEVCGGKVDPHASFCESCGATLKPVAGNTIVQTNRPRVAQEPSRKVVPQHKKERRRKFHFERWQLVTGGVSLALVAFFAYNELSRPSAPAINPTQENFPAQSAPSLQDIEVQQARVDANQKDGASLIRLANMLHDAALHDSRLLMRAIKAYSQYLALKTGDTNARANAQVDMGICYFEMARVDTNNAASLFSKAIEEMQAAFTSNPSHQPAAFNIGIVNLNTGNMDESTKWFRKTVEINPNSELGKRAQQLLEQHSPPGSPN